MPAEKKGWGWPANSKKAHYFVNGYALCGKWAYGGSLDSEVEAGPDDCRACVKKLEKLK